MSQQQHPNELYVTPEAIVVFPHFFEAKPVVINGQPQGEPMYSCSLLFDPEDVKEMKRVAVKLAQQKWPGRDLRTLSFPFKDGNELADQQAQKGREAEFYRGKVVVKCSSKYAPQVLQPNKQEMINPSDMYSGCVIRVEVNLKTFTAGVNEGVKAYLNHVLKVRDGERLTGRSAQDAFAGVQVQETNEDPTAGAGDALDDDLPF